MSNPKVGLVINDRKGRITTSTWDPRGSPASPILFTIYLSGLFVHVAEREVSGMEAHSFVDDLTWLAEDKDENVLGATPEAAAPTAKQWEEQNAVTFDTTKRKPYCWVSGQR